MHRCPFCNDPQPTVRTQPTRDAKQVTCSGCGNYQITNDAEVILKGDSHDERAMRNISGWLQQNQDYLITSYSLDNLLHLSPPSFLERINGLLIKLQEHSSYYGQQVDIFSKINYWISASWSINEQELTVLFKFLEDNQLVTSSYLSGKIASTVLTPQGFIKIESLIKANKESDQGFVAMWFDPQMDIPYSEAIAPAITTSGYRPHRVDQREHNGKIDDEIILQIRKSRFVVADFTGHRGGVYYEAGFAQGLNLEVFWTCSKNDASKLHFDIRQYNCILWDPSALSDFQQKLAKRIEAVLGKGNYKLEKDL